MFVPQNLKIMNKIIILFFILLFFSCKNKDAKEIINDIKER